MQLLQTAAIVGKMMRAVRSSHGDVARAAVDNANLKKMMAGMTLPVVPFPRWLHPHRNEYPPLHQQPEPLLLFHPHDPSAPAWPLRTVFPAAVLQFQTIAFAICNMFAHEYRFPCTSLLPSAHCSCSPWLVLCPQCQFFLFVERLQLSCHENTPVSSPVCCILYLRNFLFHTIMIRQRPTLCKSRALYFRGCLTPLVR